MECKRHSPPGSISLRLADCNFATVRFDLTRNRGFPDACMSIEHFISNAVKDERIVTQPFPIVDFIGVLQGKHATLGPSGDSNHQDRGSYPKIEIATPLARMGLEGHIGNRLPAW